MTRHIGAVKTALIAVVLLAGSSSAWSWNGPTSVSELQVEAGVTSVRFTAFPSHGCGATYDGRFLIGGANPTANERAMYATLVAAVVAGKQVWVVTDQCEGGFEKVVFVGLYP